MEKKIEGIMNESLDLHERITVLIPQIKEAAEIMIGALSQGNKIMFAGNGGSAGDAQHLAAELVNRYKMERAPLAGISLSTDTSTITAVGNDYSFDEIYSKQVRAIGVHGDVFVGISTSGNSQNILKALNAAQEMGIITIGLTGKGGMINRFLDCCIAVPSSDTPRIQEAHILIGHILCEIIEERVGQKI